MCISVYVHFHTHFTLWLQRVAMGTMTSATPCDFIHLSQNKIPLVYRERSTVPPELWVICLSAVRGWTAYNPVSYTFGLKHVFAELHWQGWNCRLLDSLFSFFFDLISLTIHFNITGPFILDFKVKRYHDRSYSLNKHFMWRESFGILWNMLLSFKAKGSMRASTVLYNSCVSWVNLKLQKKGK